MRRLVLSLAVVGATLASAAGMALAQATTDTFHQTVPADTRFDPPLLNTCTDEEIRLTGEVSILTHVTEDANGGLHFVQQYEFKGVSGTGLESRTRYRAVGSVKTGQYIAPGQPRVATVVLSFDLVSTGPSDNERALLTARIMFNANGEPTVQFVQLTGRCEG
jgi:hypothetical protein